MNLDTFIKTLYRLIDQWYQTEMGDKCVRHAGAETKMSDSQVLTVAIAGQWRVGVPWQSERGVVRYMLQHGQHWFPHMLHKSQFNARVRQLWAVLVRLQQVVAGWLHTEADLYECVDCTPIPSCSLAQAASQDRHWLSGGLGRGGNNGGWFYGEQVLLSVSATGAVTGWLMGLAQVDDRWMLEAFVSTRHSHMQLIGPAIEAKRRYECYCVPDTDSFSPAICAGCRRPVPYLADQGFNGARWQSHWQMRYGVSVITAPPANTASAWKKADMKWLSSHRQIVETVIARLSEVFGLKRLNAHTDWGKLTRLAAKMAAYNLGCFLNRTLGRADGALATLIL